MPLIKSASPDAIAENIRRSLADRKPRAEAVAIAMSMAREARRGKRKAATKRAFAEKVTAR